MRLNKTDIIPALFKLFFFTVIISSCINKQSKEKSGKSGSSDAITRITFGSCNKHDKPQPLWSPILANEPDLWIWLGDNIYGDTEDMELMAKKYRLQKENAQYQKLVDDVPVVGTWDDHDYGENNAGKYYPKKAKSQELLLDFLDVPEDHPRRKSQGVYWAHDYGRGNQKVKVILLDTRYFRDSYQKNDKGIIPNKTGDILGEAQWNWLENELNSSEAAFNIIASGIQIIATQHGSEKWANFPSARKKLFNLVRESGAQNVIFLSGDRHKAEIAKLEYEGIDYPLYEITSSGLTHSGEVHEPNKFRVGELVLDLNFGMIEFHWDERPLKAGFYIKGLDNKTFVNHKVTYD